MLIVTEGDGGRRTDPIREVPDPIGADPDHISAEPAVEKRCRIGRE